MKNKKKIRGIAVGAIIASMYLVLTYLTNALGLANGAIQIRFSEALTILPIFTPYAIPGLFIGCIIANILTGCLLPDIIFGSLATLLGAIGSYFLRKHPGFATVPPILANTLIIPFILMYVYNLEGAVWYFFVTIFIGEFISCGVLGYLLQKTLSRRNIIKNI